MKYVLVLTILLSFFLNVNGQGRTRHFNDAGNIKTYVLRSSDTIVIDQDSVMMMNRRTYMLYESFRRNNASYKTLSIAYDSLLRAKEAIYQAQIKKQTEDYDRLHTLFDSLNLHSMDVINSTNQSLKEIKDSLTSSAQILNQAKANLTKTKQELKHEKIQKVLGRFYWGLGGMGIGAAGTILAFLFLHK